MRFKPVILIIIILSIVNISYAAISSCTDSDCGYCGNPYLLEIGYQDYYCSQDARIHQDDCCPDNNNPNAAMIYDTNDPYKPDNQAECLGHFFNTDFNSVGECKYGCCHQPVGVRCAMKTNYTCLGTTGSPDYEFSYGFTGEPNPCKMGDIYVWDDCAGGTVETCSSYDGKESLCKSNDCSWCDGKCYSNCDSCVGKPVLKDGECREMDRVCSSFSHDNCGPPNNDCSWCSSELVCIEECNQVLCPNQPFDSNGDNECEALNCDGLMETECINQDGCYWCPDGMGSCVGTCSDCTYNSRIGSICTHECNDGLDQGFSGADDEEDICCMKYWSEGIDPREENTSCVSQCGVFGDNGFDGSIQDSLSDVSYYTNIESDYYCTCGIEDSVPVLFKLSEDNSEYYCCNSNGQYTAIKGGCKNGWIKFCVYDPEGDEVDCGYDGNNCPMQARSSSSIALPNSAEAWRNAEETNCFMYTNIPYPQDLDIQLQYTNDYANEYFRQEVDHSTINTTVRIYLKEVDDKCYKANIQTQAYNGVILDILPKHCNEEPLYFSWDLVSYYGNSCLDQVVMINISAKDGTGFFTVNPTEIERKSKDMYKSDTLLEWGEEKDYTIAMVVKCSPDDPECEDTFTTEPVTVTASPGDFECSGELCTDPIKEVCEFNITGDRLIECNESNKVIETQVCTGLEYCTYSSGVAMCRPKSECTNVELGGINFFGMYYDSDEDYCHYDQSNSQGERKFCYMDYSSTNVDRCFSCSLDTFCYDYKGRDACELNWCERSRDGIKGCSWSEAPEELGDLGQGYCYAKKYNGTEYCDLCSKDYTDPSALFHNVDCSSEVCDILGGCYSKDVRNGESCTACIPPEAGDTMTTCYDLKDKDACIRSDGIDKDDPAHVGGNGRAFSIHGSTCDGIKCAEEDGFIPSFDACGIGKCYWTGSECVKDANSDGRDDCDEPSNAYQCKRDSYPAKTKLDSKPSIITTVSSKGAELSLEHPYSGDSEDSMLYYCIDTDGTCDPETEAEEESENSFFVPLTVDEHPQLDDITGTAYLRYFSIDRYKNVEPIRTSAIPLDSQIPDITYELDLQKSTFSTYYLEMHVNTDEFVHRCESCMVKYTGCGDNLCATDVSSCKSASGYDSLSPFWLDAGTTFEAGYIPEGGSINLSYSDLTDGIWTLSLRCEDLYGNVFTNWTEVYVDLTRKIKNEYPSKDKFTMENVLDGDLNISFDTEDKRLNCFYDDGTGWYHYRDNEAKAYEVQHIADSDDWHYTTLYTDSYTESLEGYHKFDITCQNFTNQCDDEQSEVHSSQCSWDDSYVSFVVDTHSPETKLMYNSFGTQYVDFESDRYYTDTNDLVLVCDDSYGAVDYGALGPFGCQNISWCVNTTGINMPCTPEVNEFDSEFSGWKKMEELGLEYSSSFTICFYSEDAGSNVEAKQCHNVLVDSSAPRIDINFPDNETKFGPMSVVGDFGVQIEGEWEDDSADKVRVNIFWYNSTDDNSTGYLSYPRIGTGSSAGNYHTGTFDPSPLRLFSGVNILEFTVKEHEDYIIGLPNKATIKKTYYWDKIGPDIITLDQFKAGDGSSVIGKAIEYGVNMTINITAFDTYWLEDNISAVRLKLECVDGVCLQSPIHYFWMNKFNGSWGLFIEPNSPNYILQDGDTSYNNKDLLPGNYNVTITAWDGYATIEKSAFLPETSKRCNNNSIEAGTFEIVDTTPADVDLEFLEGDYVDSMNLDYHENTYDYSLLSQEGLKRFGFELGRKASIMVRSSEPIDITALYLTLKEDNDCKTHLTHKSTTDNGRLWTYDLTIPNVPCFRNLQDTSNSLGNNTKFVISFNDSAGNYLEEEDLGYMEIDTKSPYISLIEPNPDGKLIRGDEVNITGIVSYDGMYENMPDRYAKVFVEGGFNATSQASNTFRLFSDKLFKINHRVDSSLVTVDITDSSVDCTDTEGIRAGQYIRFDTDRKYQEYYRINYVSNDQSCKDNDYRTIILGSLLESNLSTGDSAMIYDGDHPMGWFQFTLPLVEGVNEFRISAMDDLENTGNETSITVMRDTIPPSIAVISPNDGDIISENQPVINFTVQDDIGGIDGSSIYFKISMINESGLYEALYECGESGSSRIIDGKLDCDIGHDVNVTFIPKSLGDGKYTIHVNATDVMGYPISNEWSFIINSEVPRAPSLNLGPYLGNIYDSWYTRYNSTDIDLVFNSTEVIGIVNVTIGSKELKCSNKESSYRFNCSYPFELSEGEHDVEITARRLKYGEEDYVGRDGKWTLSFEVDITEPKLNVVEIPPSNEYLNRVLSGKAEDENMYSVDIIGDTLYGNEISFLASGSFEQVINISPKTGVKQFTIRAFDKAGNMNITNITAYIDRSQAAPILYDVQKYTKDGAILVEGFSPDLDNTITLAIGRNGNDYKTYGHDVVVSSVPEEELLVFDSDFCNSYKDITYELNTKLTLSCELAELSYEVESPEGTIYSDDLTQGDKSDTIELSQEGTYRLKTMTDDGSCDRIVMVDSNEELRHRFNITIENPMLSKIGESGDTFNIYAIAIDEFGNRNNSADDINNIYLDMKKPNVTNPFPLNNINRMNTVISFDIEDDYGINTSSIIINLDGKNISTHWDVLEMREYPTKITVYTDDISLQNQKTYSIAVRLSDLAGNVYNEGLKESWRFKVDNSTPSEPVFFFDGADAEDDYYFGTENPKINIEFSQPIEFPFKKASVGEEDVNPYILVKDQQNESFELNHSIMESNDPYTLVIYAKRQDIGEFSIGGPYESPRFYIDVTRPDISFNNSGRLSKDALDILGSIKGETDNSMLNIVAYNLNSSRELIAEGKTDFAIETDKNFFVQGNNIVKITAYDKAGNNNTKNWKIKYDSLPPQTPVISSDLPQVNGVYQSVQSSFNLNVTIFEDAVIYSHVNGRKMLLAEENNGSYRYSISLDNGMNIVNITAMDEAGNEATSETIRVFSDRDGPSFYGYYPSRDAVLGISEPERIEIIATDSNTGIDKNSLIFVVNGEVIPNDKLSISDDGTITCQGSCLNYKDNLWNVYTGTSGSGMNFVKVKIANFGGTYNETVWSFKLDTTAPHIVSWSPEMNSQIDDNTPWLEFTFKDQSEIESVKLDDRDIQVYTKDMKTYWYASDDTESFDGEYDFDLHFTIAQLTEREDRLTMSFDGSVSVSSVNINGVETGLSTSGKSININYEFKPFMEVQEHDIVIHGKGSLDDLKTIRSNLQLNYDKGLNVSLGVNNLVYSTSDLGYTYHYQAREEDLLEDGLHTLKVKAKKKDVGGDTSGESMEFIIDTSEPDISIDPPYPKYSSSRTFKISGIWSDLPEQDTLDRIEVRSGSSSCQSPVNVISGTFSCDSIELMPGKNTVYATIYDLVGHMSKDNTTVYVDSDGAGIAMVPDAKRWGKMYVVPESDVDVNLTITREGHVTVKREETIIYDEDVYPYGCDGPDCPGMPYSFNINVDSLQPGINTISSIITDSFGVNSTVSTNIIYDDSDPKIDSFQPGDGAVTGNTEIPISFFVVEERLAEVKLYLNNQLITEANHIEPFRSFMINENVVRYSGLYDGWNNITIYLEDASGRSINESFFVNVVSDSPTMQALFKPENRFINDSTPEIVFGFEDQASVSEIMLSSESFMKDLTSEFEQNDDLWSYTSDTLGSGKYTLSVYAKNSQYVEGQSGATERVFYVDLEAPHIEELRYEGEYAKENPVTIAGKLSDNFADDGSIEKIEVYVGDELEQEIDDIQYIADGERSFTFDLLLRSYETSVTVKAYDKAGNIGTGYITVKFDPDMPLSSLVPLDLFKDGGYYSDSNTVTFQGYVDEKSQVKVYNDDQSQNIGWKEGTFVFDLDLKDGRNEILFESTDLAGNINTSNVIIVNVDKDKPICKMDTLVPAEGSLVGNSLLEFEVQCRDASSGFDDESFTLWQNEYNKGHVGSYNDEFETYFYTAELEEGENDFKLDLKDRVGNEIEYQFTYSYDPNAPTLVSYGPPRYVNNLRPTFELEFTPKSELSKFVLGDEGDIYGRFTSQNMLDYRYQIDHDLLENKDITMNIEAIRYPYGKVVSKNSPKFMIDTQKPSLDMFSDVPEITNVRDLEIVGKATDNGKIDRVEIQVNDNSYDILDPEFDTVVSLTRPESIINITAIDSVGNKNSMIYDVSLDVTNPIISLYTQDLKSIDGIIYTDSSNIRLFGYISEPSTVTVENYDPMSLNTDSTDTGNQEGDFSIDLNLRKGYNEITLVGNDLQGNQDKSNTLKIIYDDRAPMFVNSVPTDGEVIGKAEIQIGMIIQEDDSFIDPDTLKMTITNDKGTVEVSAKYSDDKIYYNTVPGDLTTGSNTITIDLEDVAGNHLSHQVTIQLDTSIPSFDKFNSPYRYISDKTPLFSFSFLDDVILDKVLLDNEDITSRFVVNGTNTYTSSWQSELIEGEHTLIVEAVKQDIIDSHASSHDELSFIVDTTAPDVSTDPLPSIIPECTFTMEGDIEERNAINDIHALIGGLEYPLEYQGDRFFGEISLPTTEPYDIQVVAEDMAGNIGTDRFSLSCDPYVPNITISIFSDIVNKDFINVFGDVSEKVSIKLYVDSKVQQFSAEENFDTRVKLDPGINEIYAIGTDQVGHEVESNHIFVNYDNVKPEIRMYVPDEGDTTGSMKPNIMVYVTDEGAGLDPSTAEWSINTFEKGQGRNMNERYWYECQLGDLFDEQENSVKFSISDRAGNTVTKDWSFNVDSKAPSSVELKSPLHYTNDNTPIIQFTYTEPVALNLVDITTLGEVTSLFTSENSKTFNYEVLDPLPEGQYLIDINAIKSLQGSDTMSSETREFIVDLTAPSVYIDDLPDDTSDLVHQIKGSWDENYEIDKITVSINGGLENEVEHIDTIRKEFSTNIRLKSEKNNIVVYAYDKAGNIGSTSDYINLDTSKPLIQVTNVSNSMRTDFGVYKTSKDIVDISGNYFERYLDSIYLESNPDLKAKITETEFTLNTAIKGDPDTETENRMSILIRDKSGEHNSDEITVIKDKKAPDITVDNTREVAITKPLFEVSTDEDSSYCRIKYIDINGKQRIELMDQITEKTFSHQIEYDLQNAMNTLTFTCSDLLGNINTESFSLRVDTEPPEFRSVDVLYSQYDDHYTVYNDKTRIIVSLDEASMCRFNDDPFNNTIEGIYSTNDSTSWLQLEDGQRYDYRITCTDEAGNIGENSITLVADMFGAILIQGITPQGMSNIDNPVISFSTPSESVCSVSYLNGDRWTDPVEAEASEGNMYEIQASDVDVSMSRLRHLKTYEFKIECVDVEGIRSNGLEYFDITYDNEVSNLEIIEPTEGYFSPDGKVKLIAKTEPGSSVKLLVNGRIQGAPFITDGNVEIPEILLDNDGNEIKLVVTDEAGNTISDSVNVRYDLDFPEVDAIIPMPGSVIPYIDLIRVIMEDYDNVDYEKSRIVMTDSEDKLIGSSSGLKYYPPELVDGEYYLFATVYDNEGNVAYGTSDLKISKDAPNVTLKSPADWAGIYQRDKNVTFEGEIESESIITQAELSLNGESVSNCEGETCDYDGYISFLKNKVLQGDENSYYFLQKNEVGRYSLYPGEIKVDDVGLDWMDMNVKNAKVYSASALGISSAVDRGEIYVDYINDRKPEIKVQFREKANITSYSLKFGSKDIPLEMKSSNPMLYTFIPETLEEDGLYLFHVDAEDMHGNGLDYSPVTRTFILDTVAPEISINQPDNDVYKQSVLDVELLSDEKVKITDAYYNNLTFNFGDMYKDNFYKPFEFPDGDIKLNIVVEDLAGNTAEDSSSFKVVTEPLKIDIVNPSYSIANNQPYPVKINTSRDSKCKYSLNQDLSYENMNWSFKSDGFSHEIESLSTGAKLYVACVDIYDFTAKKMFEILVDMDVPAIETISLLPHKITEYPETSITVATDEPTICKAWTFIDGKKITTEFPKEFGMEHEAMMPTATKTGSHKYYIQCEDKGPNPTPVESAQYTVDLGSSFIISDNTPEFFTTGRSYLNFSTNKYAECYYGNTSAKRRETYIITEDNYNFYVDLDLDDGEHDFYIYCYRKHNITDTVDDKISFVIDKNPPYMEYVNISNPELNNTLFTWRTDRLHVKWKARDNGTGISEYSYQIYEYNYGEENLVSYGTTNKDELDITGLDLEDQTKYYVTARAKDNAGTYSLFMESDYIVVDNTLKPDIEENESDDGGIVSSASCLDGFKDGDETDIDCGGSRCGPTCKVGDSCEIDSDCESAECRIDETTYQYVCQDSYSCDTTNDLDCDGVSNVKDSDIDGDGLSNWEDPDDDNDGVCDTLKSPLNDDTCTGNDDDDDNDNTLDPYDIDSDDDLNNDDTINGDASDIDGDGLSNWEDPDDDNDGLCDSLNSPLNDDGCESKDDDMDNDGVLDKEDYDTDDDLDENAVLNSEDFDIDGDNLTNWEDPDDDNDGLCDTADSPLNDDSCEGDDLDDDNDGIADPDDKDTDNDLDNDGIINSKDTDIDGDMINNNNDPDDDNDGIADYDDLDKDNNGVPDREEDYDNDGIPNGWEDDHRLNKNDRSDGSLDADSDGLTNVEEYQVRTSQWGRSTDPQEADSDSDGWNDKKELDSGYDPNDPSSHPKSLWPIVLLILLLLMILGAGGYFGYQKYMEMQSAKSARLPRFGTQSFGPPVKEIPNQNGFQPIQRPVQSTVKKPVQPVPVQPKQATPQKQEKKEEKPKDKPKDDEFISMGDIKDNTISKYIPMKELTLEGIKLLRGLSIKEIEDILKGKSKTQIKEVLQKLIKKTGKRGSRVLEGMKKRGKSDVFDKLGKLGKK